MAIERDPVTKPATAQPAAAADDPRDKALADANAKHAALEKKYNDEMQQLAQMVQSGKLKVVEETAKPAADDADDGLIDRKELKKAIEEIKTSAANVIVETTSQSARHLRSLAKDNLRTKLKNFDKYETEIDALLEKIPDPRVSSDPATIRQVHKLVLSNHFDEEMEATIAEKKEQWEEDLKSKGWEPEEIQEEIEEREEALREDAEPAERGGTRQAKPVARSSGVAPAGNASGARLAAARRQAAAPALTREQRVMAEEFGIKNAEEWHKYADKNWRPDTLGFNGRKRI